MSTAKRLADLLTLSRFFLAGLVLFLALLFGESSLPYVFTLLLVGWTTDAVDGPLARRAPDAPHTWVGDNDALADTALAVATLVAFSFCGYISVWLVVLYLVVAGALVVRTRSQSLNMAFVALIHAFTIYGSFHYSLFWGLLGVAWILLALLLNWRRFTYLVRFFLRGMARLPRGEKLPSEANQNGSHAFLRH